jgi:hypothetical protein
MDDSVDLENRELCPDGCCVGVIGPDGRCSECGLSREATPDSVPDDPPFTASVPGDFPESAQSAQQEEGDEGLTDEPDLESRIPCADDTCVGIIGADGRCGTCGLAAPPTSP